MVMNTKEKESLKELVILVQSGNLDSFEKLYKDYYYYVWKIGNDYFHDRAKAEDVTQEVFINVYNHIHKLQTPGMFVPWLNRIAYNCCHKIYTKEKRDSLGHACTGTDDNFLENIKQEEPDSMTRLEQKEIQTLVYDLLKDMKEENQRIGYLRFHDELSYQEICEQTNLPLGTVSTRLKRIKAKLQKELKKRGVNGFQGFPVFLAPIFSKQSHQPIKQLIKSPSKSCLASLHTLQATNLIVPAFAISTAVVAPITVNAYQEKQVMQETSSIASIQDIKYSDMLTNQPIPVDIQISNHEFDQVLLDGQEDFVIFENGTHIIEVYKDQELLDSKQFEIKNIDRTMPEAREIDTKDSMQFALSDNQGIDYQKIQMFINGEESNEFQVDKGNNMLTIQKDVQHKITLTIPDNAGNTLKLDVHFYEIDKNMKEK